MAKIPMSQVPYKGGPEGMLDVIARRIDLIVDTPTVLLEPVRAGQLRALAVTGSSRFFALPDTPTVAEGGITDYETSSWLGLAAPAGLSAEIVARLNVALREILAEDAVAARLRGIGSNPAPSSGEALRDKVAAEVVKWTRVVADAQIERL
jgi:tripartite-type tricarboxylate transporter receptor subunit TctC